MKKDFITVSPDSGQGDGSINLVADPNLGDSRVIEIVISSKGGITNRVKITQKGFTGYLPNEAPKGVYIMDINQMIFPKESWNTSLKPSGIFVKTDRDSYCISLTEFYRTVKWGEKVLVPNCFTSTERSKVKDDYNGRENTSAIVTKYGDRNFAAKVCLDYQFPHGSYGYLPSIGEWYDVLENGDVRKIDECLLLVEGNTLFNDGVSDHYKWSSSQYDKGNAWCIDIIKRDKNNIFCLDREKTVTYPNSNILGTRPFVKLTNLYHIHKKSRITFSKGPGSSTEFYIYRSYE